MTTPRPDVPALARRLLRAALPPDEAASLEGDLLEELRERRAGQFPARWPRLWLTAQAIRLAGAAALWSMLRRLRTTLALALRDSWRTTRSAPATSALVIAVIAISMAAATVTFSVVDTVVLRPLPFPDHHRLIAIHGETDRGPIPIVAIQDYFNWRDHVRSADIAAWTYGGVHLKVQGERRVIVSVDATPDLLDVLGVAPALGSGFHAATEASDQPLALISDRLWRAAFGGDAGIIGRSVMLDATAVRVAGVMSPAFEFPVGESDRIDVWLRYAPTDAERVFKGGRSSSYRIVGRLRDGATLAGARAEIEAATETLARAYPHLYGGWRVRVTSLLEAMIGPVRGWMLMVLIAVALVMIIACVNVANLLLARGARRARDLGLRASLGAARWQLVSALLIESTMLAVAAGSAGVLVASRLLHVVTTALPQGIARAGAIAVDTRVLLCAAAASLGSGLLFGLLPALQLSRVDITALLRDGGARTSFDRARSRSALLVVQVAVVVVLVVATGLLVGSFARVVRADLGFDPDPLIAMRLRVGVPRGASPEIERATIEAARAQALSEALTVPGVIAAALSSNGGVPLFNAGSSTMRIELSAHPDQDLSTETVFASPSYFEVLALRMTRGAPFTANDGPQAAVLDERIAAQVFGDTDPVGQTIRLRGFAQPYRVTGVVAAVYPNGAEQNAVPRAYFPLAVRTTTDLNLLARVNDVSRTTKPLADLRDHWTTLGGSNPIVIRDRWRALTASRRFSAGLMSALGALALLIGAAGIYGVLSALVGQRTRELGVRAALGATAARLVRETLVDAGRWLLLGAGIGVAAAWAIGGVLSSLLFGVTPRDPLIYALAVALLLIVGLIAAWLPARRAGRVDPLIVLRAD